MEQFIPSDKPFADVSEERGFLFFPWGMCAASWIAPEVFPGESCAAVFQLDFTLAAKTETTLYVTADEHYELMLDGVLLGRGPVSGPADCRFFDGYRGEIAAGAHRLQAVVFYWGRRWLDVNPAWRIPDFRMSGQLMFFLTADGTLERALGTGLGDWHCRVQPLARKPGGSVVPDCRLKPLQRQLEAPETPVRILEQARCKATANEYTRMPALAPSPLPPMARHRIVPSVHGAETDTWRALLAGDGEVVLPAHGRHEVVLEFADYTCAWMELEAAEGDGAVISTIWAEAGFLPDGTKGRRDSLEGKTLIGFGDDFLTDGAASQLFRSPFWRCGRYLQLTIVTAGEPLRLRRLEFQETHYPLERCGHFECDEPRLASLGDMFFHTLEMCSHDTFIDCPYYERLQYAADTRLQSLGTYAFAHDDRLIRQALRMLAASRAVDSGLTLSRYPSEVSQIIPPFSLWLICMAHDNALWRGNRDLHRELLPRWREIAFCFHGFLNGAGVVESPHGWNFVDWCPGWPKGYPPGTEKGPSCLLSLIYELALQALAGLEAYAGEPEMQALFARWAAELHEAVEACFLNETSGLFYDDCGHASLSEHVQALAVLTGRLPASQLARTRDHLLANDGRMTACTVSFSHYLFEAARLLRCPELFHRRMGLWYSFLEQGFATVPEQPEPSRSDCHAWGVHPYFHCLATALGIRPLDFGFRRVQVAPLAFWPHMRGVLPHPNGTITVEYTLGRCRVTLPRGIAGQFEAGGQVWPLPDDGQEHEINWFEAN